MTHEIPTQRTENLAENYTPEFMFVPRKLRARSSEPVPIREADQAVIRDFESGKFSADTMHLGASDLI